MSAFILDSIQGRGQAAQERRKNAILDLVVTLQMVVITASTSRAPSLAGTALNALCPLSHLIHTVPYRS